MDIVWVLERPKVNSVAALLIGDYAVRVFASMSSFQRLMKLSRNRRPTVLIADLDDLGTDPAKLSGILDYLLPSVTRIFLATNKRSGASSVTHGGGTLQIWAKPVEGLAFSRFISDVIQISIENNAGAEEVLRFRDIMFNFESFTLEILPHGHIESLTHKEARLLKLFLDKPGKCLTREEIKATIWEGIAVSPRTIDSQVSRLRSRLKEAEVNIESVYGGGYVLR